MAKKLKIKISELNQKSNITGFEYMPSSYIANTSEGWKSYKIGTTQLATYIGDNLDTFELSDDIEGLYAYLNDVKAYANSGYAYNKEFNKNITEKASDWAGAYNGYFDAHYVGNVSKLGTYITSNTEGFHMKATEVDGKGIRIGASWDKDSDDDVFTYIPVAGDTTYGLITLTDVMKAFGDGDMTFPVASDTVSGCISTSEVRNIVSNFKHPFGFTLSHDILNVAIAYNCDGSYSGKITIPKATYTDYGVVNLSNLKDIASSYSKGISYNIDFVLTYNIENVYNCPPMTQSTAGSVTYNRIKNIAFNTGHDFFIRNVSDSEGNSVLQYSFDGGNTYKDALTFPSVDYTMPLYGMVSETVMKNAANKALMATLESDDLKAKESTAGLVNGPLLDSITKEAAKDFKTWFVPASGLQIGTYYGGTFRQSTSNTSEVATIEKFDGTTYGLTTYADIENYLSDNYTLLSNNIVTNITPKLYYGTSGVEFEVTYNMSADPSTTCYITAQSMKFNKIDNTVTDKNTFGVINLAYFNQVMAYTLGYWKNQAKEEYDKQFTEHDLTLNISAKANGELEIDNRYFNWTNKTDLYITLYDGQIDYDNILKGEAKGLYSYKDGGATGLNVVSQNSILDYTNITISHEELAVIQGNSLTSNKSKFTIVVSCQGLFKQPKVGERTYYDEYENYVCQIIHCNYDDYIAKSLTEPEIINVDMVFNKVAKRYFPTFVNNTTGDLVVNIMTYDGNINPSSTVENLSIKRGEKISPNIYCGNSNTTSIQVITESSVAAYVKIDGARPTDNTLGGWEFKIISGGQKLATCKITFTLLGGGISENYTMTFTS